MRLKTDFKSLEINIGAWRHAVDEALTAAVRAGARRWLEAILTKTIPVWSGASAATFLKLADLVDFPLHVMPRGGRVPDRTQMGLDRSSAELYEAGGSYVFEFDTNLIHLVYNEYHDANAVPDLGLRHQLIDPGPYGFQEIGKDAFLEFARTVSVPSPFAFLKTAVA